MSKNDPIDVYMSTLVPMVVEEPSVGAAVSNMARLARCAGGFQASADRGIMIGQIQLTDVRESAAGVAKWRNALPALERAARSSDPALRSSAVRAFAQSRGSTE